MFHSARTSVFVVIAVAACDNGTTAASRVSEGHGDSAGEGNADGGGAGGDGPVVTAGSVGGAGGAGGIGGPSDSAGGAAPSADAADAGAIPRTDGGSQASLDPDSDRTETWPLVEAVGACSLWPAPAAAAPQQVSVGGTLVRADESDCNYVLGESVPLPVLPEDDIRLLFQLDVNGDGVDDLFTRSDGEIVRFSSTLDDGEVDFRREPCDVALDSTLTGHLLRDLNGDGVLDLLVNDGLTLEGYVNLEGGLRLAFRHELEADDGWCSVMDAVVGDFSGDGLDDLAVGLDCGVTPGGLAMGTLLLAGAESGDLFEPPKAIAWTNWGFEIEGAGRELGYLTSLADGRKLLGVNSYGLWTYEQGSLQGVELYLSPSPTLLQELSGAAAGSVVIGLEQSFAVFDSSDLGHASLEVATLFRHALDREMGGGYRRRTYTVRDLDGDGDEDVVELNLFDRGQEGDFALAIHHGNGAQGFLDPQTVTLPDFWSERAESFFVAIGTMGGRVLFNEGTRDVPGASVQALGCE